MPPNASLSPRLRGPTEPPQTLIDIGARRTVVVVRRAAADLAIDVPIGARRIAEELFRHDPPQPAELEAAIDAVEDQLTRVAGQISQGSALRLTGPFVGELRHALVQTERANDAIALDEVEQLFQRLASASLGNPAARRGLPTGNGFVAAALILRELMHHLGFVSVSFHPETH